MANNFALTFKGQNNHAASTVIGAVTHQIPDQTIKDTDLQSAVFEITGTSASNTLAIGASGIVTTNLAGAGAVTQKDPVTGSNLNFTNHRGLMLVCDRAASGTAPTCIEDNKTSTTWLAIGTGSKAFTVASGLAFVAGQRVRAVSAANSANYRRALSLRTRHNLDGYCRCCRWIWHAGRLDDLRFAGCANYQHWLRLHCIDSHQFVRR